MSSVPDFDIPHRFLLDFLSQEDDSITKKYAEYRDNEMTSKPDISHTTLDKMAYIQG